MAEVRAASLASDGRTLDLADTLYLEGWRVCEGAQPRVSHNRAHERDRLHRSNRC